MIPRGARLHAFLHGLFVPADLQLAREAFEETLGLFRQHGLDSPKGRAALIASLAGQAFASVPGADDRLDGARITDLVGALFDFEALFVLPEIDWSRRRTTSQLWALRDQILAQHALVADHAATTETLAAAIAGLVSVAARASPLRTADAGAGAAIRVATPRIDLIDGLADLIEWMAAVLVADDLVEARLFVRIRERLGRNLIVASGGDPDDPDAFRRPLRNASRSDIADRRELAETYLGGTPLTRLLDGEIAFTIPESRRFEHHHIVAGTGHGKSQTLQYLIAHDLEAVARGRASVIVIDSQGDLIDKVAGLARFAPGAPLHDRLVLIDPSDVEYPVSLNLFDVGIERLAAYPMLERERLTNSILELYDFVLGSLLDAGMTQKQSVIFRYVTRLMLYIPDATIHTLRELMEPGGEVRHQASIAGLTGSARQFFETEFKSKEFEQTKRQVLRRLWGILENQTFERMFSHPRSRLDLHAEMNAGKVILINTAKDLLKENGTQIFGRFFIALIAQAAQERAILPEHLRLPTFVYVDEAADYFDRNISIILAQARKQKVGMILAHQYLGQLDARLQDAFAANTAIKFAGGVSNKDARALAPMLGCEPERIEAEPKGAFACAVRGMTRGAVSLTFPLGHLEAMDRMTRQQRQALQDTMRARYAVHYASLPGAGPQADATADAAAAGDPAATTVTAAATPAAATSAAAGPPGQAAARQGSGGPDGPEPADPDRPDTAAGPQW